MVLLWRATAACSRGFADARPRVSGYHLGPHPAQQGPANWLGYKLFGNEGAGLGSGFAVDLHGASGDILILVDVWTLTVAKSGSGTGSVAADVGGISCGNTCAAVYDDGTKVTLTATPATGSTFTGWSGGGCSGTQPCQLKVDDATTVTATFTVKPTPEATPTATPTAAATPQATAAPSGTPAQPTIRPGAQPAPTPNATIPNTRLLKKTIKASKRTATFRFNAVGTATSFRCALTARGKKLVYKACKSPATFKKLKPGKYTFRVQAIGRAGTDLTPASTTITIKKK